MQQLAPEYGADRRRFRVLKLRGVKFRSGWHDYTIMTGGLIVFPRLVAAEHRAELKSSIVPSGNAGLDALLGGGIERGTSLLMIGPAGSGKTTIALQFARAAIERGERAAIYLFDENSHTLMVRCRGVSMPLDECVAGKGMKLQQVDPADMSPGEFSHNVRAAVERDRVSVVVIDSLNGYMNSMPEERFLLIHMHELLSYLAQQGVLTILTMAQHGLTEKMNSPIDISYLSDTVMLLRYYEAAGELRQTLAVVKKRSGRHERTLREFRITPEGIRIGEPLRDFHGVLTGVPQVMGKGDVAQQFARDGHER
jgi:circadian clock protein KaiC